jgi:hypothetical protein
MIDNFSGVVSLVSKVKEAVYKETSRWVTFLYARKGILCYTPWRPSVCPSVRPSVRTSVRPLAIWFPEHNLSSIWPTMLKLHRMIVHIG